MSFYEKLKELFPNHEEAALDDVIGLVDEELPHGAEDVKFERMCILLMENFSNQDIVMSGTHSDEDENAEYDEAQHKQNRISTIREQVIKKFPNIQFSFLDKLLNEGSVPLDYMDIVKYLSTKGYPKTDIESDALVDHEVVNIIIQVFPDACPEYIGKCMQNGECCNDVIEKFLDEGYVKKKKLRNKKTKEIHQRFVEMLPNFDPDFLYSEAARLENTTEPNIIRCLNTLMEMKDYPTVKEYDERMGKRRELLDYLFEFKIDAFLKEFSNSVSNFESATEHSLEYNDNEVELEKDRKFAEAVLCHVYKQDGCKPARVKATFEKCDYDILACCRILGFLKRPCINENALVLPDNSYKNKRMFQELAYGIYHFLVNNYLNVRVKSYQQAYDEAKNNNMLQTCKICFEDGLLFLPEECYVCRNACTFCRGCMQEGTKVAYSDGLLDIKCFANCGEYFSDGTLQLVMEPLAFCKMIQRRQIRDIREAKVDGLETCPFCDHSTVVPKDDKLFNCTECGKESCRECRHESHVPKRCVEMEYEEDVKMRTHIENQMSEALMRTCKKCARRFIKESGCNKMTCQCGMTMCYVCGASNITYSHFSALGCPQMSDQEILHRTNVLTAAQAAKTQLGVDRNPNKLKFDPSKNF